MSWQATAYVAELSDGISRSEKLMLLVLSNRHNHETERCDASVERLAKEALLRPRQAVTVLRSLEAKGFIRIEERAGKTNQYWLTGMTAATPAKIAAPSTPTPAVIPDLTPAISEPEPLQSHGGRTVGEPQGEPKQEIVLVRDPLFLLYEEKIGLLHPIACERLRAWQEAYPPEWVADAIRLAGSERPRAPLPWLAAVLGRWERDGRSPAQQGSSDKTARGQFMQRARVARGA